MNVIAQFRFALRDAQRLHPEERAAQGAARVTKGEGAGLLRVKRNWLSRPAPKEKRAGSLRTGASSKRSRR
jgi:hypothetical protein